MAANIVLTPRQIVLGIGGVRMLRALGFRVRQYHLNEGHSALLALFEISDVAARADLKTDILQELERQRQLLAPLKDNPAIEHTTLAQLLADTRQQRILRCPGEVVDGGQDRRIGERTQATVERVHRERDGDADGDGDPSDRHVLLKGDCSRVKLVGSKMKSEEKLTVVRRIINGSADG